MQESFTQAEPTIASFGLHVAVGLRGLGTFLPSDETKFDFAYTGSTVLERRIGGEVFRVRVPTTVTLTDAPTAIGSKDKAVANVVARFDTTISYLGVLVPVSFDTSFSQTLIGGVYNQSIAPLAIPEAAIGTVLGTDLLLRFLPVITIPDVGNLSAYGIGFRHSLRPYFPKLPVNIAIHAMRQRYHLDDEGDRVVDGTTTAGAVAVSRRFGPLSLYGGLQAESSRISIAYTYLPGANDADVEAVPVEFEIDGRNTRRALAGVTLYAGPVSFSLDGSLGNQSNTVSFALGFAY